MPRSRIGVFDSGFGGLTVLKALLELIPDADYLYFGDTARLPYGSKSAETVGKYAVEAANFLERQGAELVVIACNTASALALDRIETSSSVPIVGVIEPGARNASGASRHRGAVVLGTAATISSHAYHRALADFGMQSIEKACPLMVPLIEEGWIDHSVTEAVARIYLDEAFERGPQADVLVLGCTHYPLIKPLLGRMVPTQVAIIDSAEATAGVVRDMVKSKAGSGGRLDAPDLKFVVTDSEEKFRALGARFLGQPVLAVQHVDLKE